MIFILNGIGGSGKDTLVKEAFKSGLFRNINNFSNSDFSKTIMKQHFGWDGVTKDDKTRRVLAALTDLGNIYGDIPYQHILELCKKHNKPGSVTFVHIRQIDQIDMIKEAFPGRVKTVLITRINTDGTKYLACKQQGIPYTDTYDYVEGYCYDMYLNNISDNPGEVFFQFCDAALGFLNEERNLYSEKGALEEFKWVA